MTSNSDLPQWVQTIIDVHTSVAGKNVSHNERLKSDRYMVWQELQVDESIVTDNHHECELMSGSTHLFTKLEFDPWADKLESAFDASEDISWRRSGKLYEPDTKLFHVVWDWTVFV